MMTALDVFDSFDARGARIEQLEEMIRRREALATGATSRPDNGGGGRGSGDASVRLLDYVGNIEELRQELRDVRRAREEEKDCALYLTEILPPALGSVMMRSRLEGKPYREICDEMGYSVSSVKRLRREAETMCRKIKVISWDRRHVPVLSVPAELEGYR